MSLSVGWHDVGSGVAKCGRAWPAIWARTPDQNGVVPCEYIVQQNRTGISDHLELNKTSQNEASSPTLRHHLGLTVWGTIHEMGGLVNREQQSHWTDVTGDVRHRRDLLATAETYTSSLLLEATNRALISVS
jgi:hypothetical protein